MNYSEWELERQRRALAALLLGGGTAEDEDALRNEKRQGSEVASSGAGRSWEHIAGGERRFDGDAPESGGAGAWEAVPMASRDRLRQARTPEAPVSAWEEISGGTVLSRQGGGNPETDGAAGPGRGFRDGGGGFLPRPADFRTESGLGGRTVRGPVPEAGRRRTFTEGTFSDFSGAEEDGEAGSRTAPGGGETAGRRPEQAVSSYRGGEGGFGQDRRTVVQVLEEASGTGTRHGGLGDAALQAENDAKALSLAVQRDARRYDGGFMIY